jgi:hypothetical protein
MDVPRAHGLQFGHFSPSLDRIAREPARAAVNEIQNDIGIDR